MNEEELGGKKKICAFSGGFLRFFQIVRKIDFFFRRNCKGFARLYLQRSILKQQRLWRKLILRRTIVVVLRN